VSRPLPRDGDSLPTELGRPLPKPEPPKPGYTPTETPGIYRAPDGKLETRIPENEQLSLRRLFTAPGELDVETLPPRTVQNYFVQAGFAAFMRKPGCQVQLAVGESCRNEDIEDRQVIIPYDAVVTYDPVTNRTTRVA